MQTYKTVSEVVAKLNDREFAKGHIVEVNKGTAEKPRYLDVVEWHEAVRMLDEVFGPFGWSAEIVSSTSSYSTGLYTVDLTLTGIAVDDESGEVVTLKRPGRGLGLVPRSALNSDSEHDRQAHGAKSDAITNATKGLGDGFGLFLYAKKGAAEGAGQGQRANGATSNGATKRGDGARGPSPKQMKVLLDRGYTEEQVAGLEFKQWKGILDAIFGGGTPEIAPAGEPMGRSQGSAGGRRASAAAASQDEVDDIPF